MMPGARLERMIAVRAGAAARRAHHDGRALVVRLVAVHALAEVAFARGPGLLEFAAIARGIETREEVALLADARGDEILGNIAKHRLALRRIGIEQPLAAPAVQLRRQLPAEIDRVLEPVVEAEAAVRRMRMGGIAGDEDAAATIAVGDRVAQRPEAGVVDVAGKIESGCLEERRPEIEAVASGDARDRRVEEETLADVDAAEELPVAL